MKKRGFVFAFVILVCGWMWLITTPAGAREGNEEFYKTNCRVNPASEANVIVDHNGERVYYNRDQKVLWEIANDFCVSLDLLVAYNFILVPREPVQYTYIKLPPGPEELGWFPGRSLRRTVSLPNVSDTLFLEPIDPTGPENLVANQPRTRNGSLGASFTDPFYSGSQENRFEWPISLDTGVVSQLYHRNHHGVDIATEIGTPVNSMANGWVIRVETDHHIFGQLIVIDHGDDLMGVYGHLSEIAPAVEEGEFVWQGQYIAKSGNSGRSSAPHLHIELRKTFRYVDPCDYLMDCPLAAFHGPRPTATQVDPLVIEPVEPVSTQVVLPPSKPQTESVNSPSSPPTSTSPNPPSPPVPQATPNTLPPRPNPFPPTSTPSP